MLSLTKRRNRMPAGGVVPAGFLIHSTKSGAVVMQDIEQATRERAYELWVASGREHGNAENHWLAAQREILSATLGTLDFARQQKPKARQKSRAS
jgi:hypothetical protein